MAWVYLSVLPFEIPGSRACARDDEALQSIHATTPDKPRDDDPQKPGLVECLLILATQAQEPGGRRAIAKSNKQSASPRYGE